MNTLEATELEVTFIDACPPPLPDGDFQIKLDQSVSWDGGSLPTPLSAAYAFSVFGPRFTLDPSEVHAVFPPPNLRGHYQKSLPHMVLARRSLPWERTIDGGLPSKPYVPWVWLLSLSEDETEGLELTTVTLKDVFTSPDPARLKTPAIKPETGDDPDSKCLVIDLPVGLFQKCVPSRDDLPFMASARLVSVDKKEITPTTEDGWFSVVLANRFPKNGARNTQYLVSLEGYAGILAPNPVGGTFEKVRLVVLASWSFTNVDDKQTFNQLMDGLSVDRLSLPARTENADAVKALSMGYTALDHLTREGEHTVSWYRGPLLPMNMPLDTPESYPNSDAALRYDPHFGMFDVSYAASWQIGRLLCLQNPSVAAAVARVRSGTQVKLHRLLHRRELHQRIGVSLGWPTDVKSLLDRHWVTDSILPFWANDLGPKLVPGRAGVAPLLGEPADPSGLLRHRDRLPGLLDDAQAEAFGGDGDGRLKSWIYR